jgi:hypothetical protein
MQASVFCIQASLLWIQTLVLYIQVSLLCIQASLLCIQASLLCIQVMALYTRYTKHFHKAFVFCYWQSWDMKEASYKMCASVKLRQKLYVNQEPRLFVYDLMILWLKRVFYDCL